MDRTLSRIVSAGWLAVVLVLLARDLHTLPRFAWWWLAPTALTLALVLVNAVWGKRLPRRTLLTIWVVVPLLGFVRIALLGVAVGEDPFSGGYATRQWAVLSQLVIYVGFWLRPLTAMAVVALSSFLPIVSTLLVTGAPPESAWVRLPFAAMSFALIAMLVAVRQLMLQFSVAEAEARVREERRILAAAEADQQARLQRLVHDHVLATLVATLRFDGAAPAALRKQAEHTLAILDGYGSDAPRDARCDDTRQRLHDIAAIIDETCEVSIDTQEGALPAKVADTLLAAASEAIRNSVWHARTCTRRAVTATITPQRMRIEIADDGPGFDPAMVAADRMGLHRSVLGAVATLDGGMTELHTAPGAGTRVVLQWHE